ncbi:MAG TPA: polyphosphate kinase 1 [Bacteroidales bacterium]|nr:MAG: Polyphosphate kinase [Bacteroidetes bacterium ADurb.Bin217]HPH15593.1 polyphosphate kinase 1 [Bacteroidales bacterium]HPM12018.1 polyphosphate kinase 1 [Bacteroidales bacterium]
MNFDYVNRDISWLYFNYRVLEEAKNNQLPLYERLKFLAIYSNNLDEFYRVRVSYYRRLLRDFSEDHPKIKKVQPQTVIEQINALVSGFQNELMDLFHNEITQELEKNQIRLIQPDTSLTESQIDYIHQVFNADILPYLQPVILIKGRIKPFLRTGQIYIVLRMFPKKLGKLTISKKLRRPVYGLLKLPTDHDIARFIELPKDEQGNHCIMFLEDIMMRFFNAIYPGYDISAWHSVKMTRDADLDFEEHDYEELIDIISTISSTRQLGRPNRFQYDYTMPQSVLQYVAKTFELHNEDLVKAGKYHNFRDLFRFPNPKSPELEYPRFTPLLHPKLQEVRSIIRHIESNEFVLHFPYQSFNYFLHYLQEAAHDESVVEIKSTQYRVAYNSAVVKSLIQAAQNGKKVTVFVELKARFDEENNLRFAKEMKRAGIHIIYSIPGLKVHAKVALVTRITSKGKKQLSTFIGTGNFNENTATVYCDHGYFTGRPEITSEIEALFQILEKKITSYPFSHILVPNFNMIETYTSLIEHEIAQASKGKKAHIIIKMNALEDPFMIDQLYKASIAGVRIDLIIRGACCLKPNQPYSKNIRVMRIVDRFLEHDRVFYFHNGGKKMLYLGSADWMRRNLYRRIECVYPVYDDNIKEEILEILHIQLKDTVKATCLDENTQNIRIPDSPHAIRSQEAIYEFLKKKYKIKPTGE